MAQNPSSEDRFGFEFHEKTEHNGEISSKPFEATSGFALNELIGGSYRVLEFIGEGGMGLVYKVEHIHMNKILALKVLKTDHLSENVWKRFRLEAQAISRLDHANIIKIYDMNQTPDGRPFYTMELLAGESLADYLQEHQRLPINQALPIFRQVCSALAYAHERGIIHRDIKPGNIMLLEPAGSGLGYSVKIVDFGIVKVLNSGEQIGQGLTRPGEVFGSPLYMSPEQCAGSKLDARADMYSVGVTLFQALAGKPPLLGRTAAETTIMHHTAIPPAMSEVAGVAFPPELEALVAKMLAKAPEDRYSSLAEVASLLLTIERKYSGAPLPLGSTEPLRINEAVIDADLSDENIETGDVSSSSKSHRSNSVLIVAVIFCFIALIAIAFLSFRLWTTPVKRNAPAASVTSTRNDQNVESSKKLLDAELNAIEVNTSPENERAIVLFLKERKAPYFVRGKSGVVDFDFPSQFSIGVLEADASSLWKTLPAQGRFQLSQCRQVYFTANDFTLAHPQLLKFFTSNSLDCFKFIGGKPRSPELIDFILRQQRLRFLDLSLTEINDNDLKALLGLRNLSILNIDCTNVSKNALLESKLLQRLDGVGLSGLRDCTPVLQSLVASTKLRNLGIKSTKLQKSDIDIIAKMSRLQALELSNTNLADSDLEPLTKLSEITYLNLFGTKITPKSVAILRRIGVKKQVVLPAEVDAAYFGTMQPLQKSEF